MPFSSPGFQPPNALITNIKLARIVGCISQDVYGRRYRSERDLLSQTQQILSALFETEREMPSEHRVDLADTTRTFTRTGLTLYLMLLQAVMLVTRPMLLYTAQSKLKRNESPVSTVQTDNTLLDKFCSACIEAAQNTVTATHRAREQGMPAKFGFFDLDAIFQAAFVLIMAELVNSDSSTHSGTCGAIGLLEYLSSCGNMAAKTRLSDILQMCSHLRISTNDSNPDQGAQSSCSLPLSSSNRAPLPVSVSNVSENLPNQPWSGLEGLLNGHFDVFSLTQNEMNLASAWQYNEISLDGTVETDWESLERAAAPRFHPNFED